MPSAEDTRLYSGFPTPSTSFIPSAAASSSSEALPLHPGSTSTTADFDAMKRNFEAATLTNGAAAAPGATVNGAGDTKQRFPSAGSSGGGAGQQPQVYPSLQPGSPLLGGYGDVYAAAGAGSFGQLNGGGVGHGAGAAPFIPAAQQQQHAGLHAQGAGASADAAYSHSGSPYISVEGSPNPSAIPFGSPSAQSAALPQQAGYPTSNYEFDPTLSMPTSPNPYANPYYGGLGFGNSAFMGGLMSPMLGMGMGSPQMGSMEMQQGYGMQYNMMGSPDFGMSASTQTGRTVYVGNLPSDASVDELLSQVRFGPIESIKILPEKSCAFISFLDPTTAAAFHSDALMRKIRLHDQDLKIGWGKPSAVPAAVLQAVQTQGATRNVYLGNLDESVTEQTLRDDLCRFGPIDQVKIVRDKNIGFVHFLSIATAIKVTQTLVNEPEYAGRRVAFGKDRTAYVPKNQHQQQQHNMAAAAMGSMAASFGGFGAMGGFASPTMGGFGSEIGSPGLATPGGTDPNAQPGNRTIYLGNIHPETTTEEICNTIRGGILQQIRYIPDKHICFVTFVDPHCALAFYQTASFQGIALHNRRLKVGWGKVSGPTSPGIAMVVQSGGSRNVYVGNIEDFDVYSEEKLRKDFGEYGEIELVNALREKQCCFINFTNIANSIKAIEGMKANPEYSHLKISFGKDRCGGAPRSFRGFDMQTGERRSRRGDNSNGPNSARSPFTDGMPFPDMGSPIPLASFDPNAVDGFASPNINGEGTPEEAIPLGLGVGIAGPGALELDEAAAAAATTSSQA